MQRDPSAFSQDGDEPNPVARDPQSGQAHEDIEQADPAGRPPHVQAENYEEDEPADDDESPRAAREDDDAFGPEADESQSPADDGSESEWVDCEDLAVLDARPAAQASKPRAEDARAEIERRIDRRRFRHHEVLGGKYRLERSIARGGMGRVFLATQLPLGRDVAVKVVMPQQGDTDFRRRFLLEASTCAKLSHPNIVTIHDYGQTPEGDVFMAMEYLEGRSLSRVLKAEWRMSPERACRVVLQVARALRAAHRAGVVHRDLKPSNVMLLPDTDDGSTHDRVKVVDFGLAKLYESLDVEKPPQLTRAGMLLGSPRYMAPEQIRNRHIDPRTDVYALGVIFFHILTGRPPFDGDNSTDILTQHLRDAPPRMASIARDLEIPEDLERIVQRCLEKNPNDRYQTIDDFLGDLRVVHRLLWDAAGGDFSMSEFDAGSLALGASSIARAGSGTAFADHREARGGALPTVSAVYLPGPDKNVWWAVALVLLTVVCVLGSWFLILD